MIYSFKDLLPTNNGYSTVEENMAHFLLLLKPKTNHPQRKMETLCTVCKKPAEKSCSRCKMVYYCSVEHQKVDWKQHKKGCFPPGSVCKRCNEIIPFPAGICRVPHPKHLRQFQGATLGPNGYNENYSCGACSSLYTETSERPTSNDKQISMGPEWCCEGPHTIKPLKIGDERRVDNDVVVISGRSPGDINQKIQALDGNQSVKVLKLCEGGKDIILDISLPNLEEVQFEDVIMKRIVLNQLTPNVCRIWM